jgi:Phospholipid methyltransferase
VEDRSDHRVAIAWGINRLSGLDTSLNLELPLWVEVPGAAAILVGAAGVLWCGAMLSRLGIFSIPGRDRLLPKEFLATGPFRFTRNPMSLAGVTLLVGLALWNRSTLGLAVAAIVFVVFHLFVTRVEAGIGAAIWGELQRLQTRSPSVDSAVQSLHSPVRVEARTVATLRLDEAGAVLRGANALARLCRFARCCGPGQAFAVRRRTARLRIHGRGVVRGQSNPQK